MVPRKINGRSVFKCIKCGYEEEATASEVITTKIKHKETEKILVLENAEMPQGSQKIKGVICPNCKNDEAYFWILQTRSADEPATRFYKCTKCGKVWREYE